MGYALVHVDNIITVALVQRIAERHCHFSPKTPLSVAQFFCILKRLVRYKRQLCRILLDQSWPNESRVVFTFQNVRHQRGGGLASIRSHIYTGDITRELPRTQHALSMTGETSPRSILTPAPACHICSPCLPHLCYQASFSSNSFTTAIQNRLQRHQHTGSIPSIPSDVCVYSVVTSLLVHTPLV